MHHVAEVAQRIGVAVIELAEVLGHAVRQGHHPLGRNQNTCCSLSLALPGPGWQLQQRMPLAVPAQRRLAFQASAMPLPKYLPRKAALLSSNTMLKWRKMSDMCLSWHELERLCKMLFPVAWGPTTTVEWSPNWTSACLIGPKLEHQTLTLRFAITPLAVAASRLITFSDSILGHPHLDGDLVVVAGLEGQAERTVKLVQASLVELARMFFFSLSQPSPLPAIGKNTWRGKRLRSS